jgi:hypothetical protein
MAALGGGMGGMGGMQGLLPLVLGATLFGGGLGNFGGGWGRGGVGGAAASAVATDVVLNPAFQSLQNQISTLGTQVNSNNLTNQITDTTGQVLAGITSINKNVTDSNRDIISSIGAVQTAQAAGNFTTLSSINGLGRDVTAAQNQGALQQLNSFNQLNSNVLQGFNEVNRDSANAFNQVQMSLNALSAQNAACCCDLKSTITADGCATRALIESLNVQNLQGQLADAKSQLASSQQTNQFASMLSNTASTIIHHIPDCSKPK